MRSAIWTVTSSRATVALAIVLALLVTGCGSPKYFITPVATPTPVPTPSPTIDPYRDAALAARKAFASLIAKPGLSFHVEQALTLAQKTGQVADASYVLDVSGKDVKAVITVGSSDDRPRDRRPRHVGPAARPAWQRGKYADDQHDRGDHRLWRYLGPIDQLEYVGRVDGSPTRYRFRSTAPIPYRTAVMDRLGLPGSIDALELVLEADGTPVEYQFHGSSRPTSGGMADMAFEMTSRLEFSQVRKADHDRSVPSRLRSMRIATWNVNSLKARMEAVEKWLARAEPDVLLIQETKLADADAPGDAVLDAGL